MDLREAARLDRRLPMDRRRDPDMGVHILVFDRRTRRKYAHLLRIHAPATIFGSLNIHLARMDPSCQIGHCAFPERDHRGADEMGRDAGSCSPAERVRVGWSFCGVGKAGSLGRRLAQDVWEAWTVLRCGAW